MNNTTRKIEFIESEIFSFLRKIEDYSLTSKH
jgi:hypothetical protein